MRLLISLIFVLLIIPVATATVTVTLPYSAPSNIETELQSGGSLTQDTTYYGVVIAYDQNYYSPRTTSLYNYHSPISEEFSITTNSTHKSFLINWTNSNGHDANTKYQVLLTNESMNYTNSGGYGTGLETIGSTFTDGENNRYNITQENTGGYAIHFVNVPFDLPCGMNKSNGIIKVYVDGETWGYDSVYDYKYAAQRLYEEIVSAGYEDYVRWDGITFCLQGWIIIDGSSSTSLKVRNVDWWFLKGGVHVNNANGVFGCGVWTNDNVKADYKYGCDFNLLNSRYPLRSLTDGGLEIYGSYVKAANYLYTVNYDEFTYPLGNGQYYIGGAQLYMAYKLNNVKDNILQNYIRSVSSEVADSKVGIGNNWHNTDSHRLQITYNRNFCYGYECKIYDTTWLGTLVSASGWKIYMPGTGASYTTWIFNPYLAEYQDNNNMPDNFYFASSYGTLVNDAYYRIHYSMNIKTINASGDNLGGVEVQCNFTNNQTGIDYNVTWIEHEDNLDRKVTGNRYNTPRNTNSTGDLQYYLEAYNVTINQSNNLALSYNTNVNVSYSYPINCRLNLTGYEDYTFTIKNFISETDLIVKMSQTVDDTGTCTAQTSKVFVQAINNNDYIQLQSVV